MTRKRNPMRFLKTFLAVIAAFGIYISILILPIPASIGLFVRHNLVLLTLIFLVLIYFSLRLKGGWGTFAGLSLTLLLFGLPLSGLWHSGASEPFIIGGLLPFSDAASYYSDALRVVEGYRFSAFSARRPLFPALLTVLLTVTGQNLVVSLGILGALIASACYLAAREMKRSFGSLSAGVFLFVLYLFYRRVAGTTMTENLGLPLGVAAFVILWGAARKKNLIHTATGLLLLTLALNARAGTFFVLPALVLWSAFALKKDRKFSLTAFGVNLLAVALGFALNMLVFNLIADPGGMVFSNFSYTLYGVVAGGKGWMQILIDHPELAQLDDVSRSAQTYALVFDAWKAHPFNIIIGAIKNWFDYLMPKGAGAFGFIRGEEIISWVNYTFRILLSLLAAGGLTFTWKNRKAEPSGMMLWAAAGIFLSVPFVPPNDSNQMRVYAATIPFLIGFCIIGLSGGIDLAMKRKQDFSSSEPVNTIPSLIFGLTLAILAIGGSILVKNLSVPLKVNSTVCPAGQIGYVVRLTQGSLVQIETKGQPDLSAQLNVDVDSFSDLNEGYPEMHDALVEKVQQGAVLARPLDLLSLQYPLLIIDGKNTIPSGLASVCAIQSEEDELALRGWWQVKSIDAYPSAIR